MKRPLRPQVSPEFYYKLGELKLNQEKKERRKLTMPEFTERIEITVKEPIFMNKLKGKRKNGFTF